MAFPIGVSLTPPPRGMQLYSNAYVFANGDLIAQAMSVSLDKRSNSTPVNTLHKGFAGLSRGSAVSEMTVENAIPTTDFEMIGKALIDRWIQSGEPVEFGIVVGSRTTRLKGFVDQASLTHTVNDAAKYTFHVIGRFELFE